MTITSKSFRIGTQPGEYPAGNKLTDSIFSLFDSIDSVSYNGQTYTAESNWIHSGNMFDTGNILPAFADGNVVAFVFAHGITIVK